MKKFVLALAVVSALAATPAAARDSTHISFGFYAPAPVAYYQPRVAYYHPPVHRVYYAPPPCPSRYQAYGHGNRGHGYRNRNHHTYTTAWNDDRGARDYGHGYGHRGWNR